MQGKVEQDTEQDKTGASNNLHYLKPQQDRIETRRDLGDNKQKSMTML